MSKSTIQQIETIKAAADARIKELTKQALFELNQQLKVAEAEVARIKSEIAEVTGDTTLVLDAAQPGKRQKAIEKGSLEWNDVAAQIANVLQRHREGLNGKELANKLGKTEPKEIKRIQPVIQATCLREGRGVSTRFYLR